MTQHHSDPFYSETHKLLRNESQLYVVLLE